MNSGFGPGYDSFDGFNFTQLSQTFPGPLEEVAPGDRNEVDEHKISRQLATALANAGFTKNNMQMHYKLTKLLECIWQKFHFNFSGNFTEGWGYNLYSMSGHPGFDSTIAYQFAIPDTVVHYSKCDCRNKSALTFDFENNGTVRLSRESIPQLKRMHLADWEGAYGPNLIMRGKSATMKMSRCSTNPEVQFRESLLVCPYISERLAASRVLEPQMLEQIVHQPVFVCPHPFKWSYQYDKEGLPEAELDFSMLERRAFQQLSQTNGHAYMVIKYLLLETLPLKMADRQRPLTEQHCRHLLLHTLSTSSDVSRDEWESPNALINTVDRALRKLLELIGKKPEKTVVMTNFFCPEILLRLDETCCLTDKAKLKRPISLLIDRLPNLLNLYAKSLDYPTSSFVFRPLLMTISGSGAFTLPVRGLNDYSGVGFSIYRAISILLEPRQPNMAEREEFNDIVDNLSPMANTAAACLRSLLILKFDQGPGLAYQSLANTGQIGVSESFEFRSDVAPSALLKRDFAWLFRGRVSKQEPGTKSQHAMPRGTQFLQKYPLIRSIFFPSQVIHAQHSEMSRIHYSLRINFVALLYALRNQLKLDWGTVLPLLPQAEHGIRIEAQELLEQSLLRTQSVPSLLSLYRSLLQSVQPFHKQRGKQEWRWVHSVRLQLLGQWMMELMCKENWSKEEYAACWDLLCFCAEDVDNFHTKVNPTSAYVTSEQQMRSWMRALVDSELEAAFPLHDELHPLTLRLYSCFHSDKKKREYSDKMNDVIRNN